MLMAPNSRSVSRTNKYITSAERMNCQLNFVLTYMWLCPYIALLIKCQYPSICCSSNKTFWKVFLTKQTVNWIFNTKNEFDNGIGDYTTNGRCWNCWEYTIFENVAVRSCFGRFEKMQFFASVADTVARHTNWMLWIGYTNRIRFYFRTISLSKCLRFIF